MKKEFSKTLAVLALVTYALIVIFSCIMIWRTMDLSPLVYIITSSSAEVATATAFYYNKAKAENKLKIMKAYKIKPEREDIE